MWIMNCDGPRSTLMQVFVRDVLVRSTVARLLTWVGRLLVAWLGFVSWLNRDLVVTNLNRYSWNTSSRSNFTSRNVLTSNNVITGWGSWRNRNRCIRLTSQISMTNFNVLIVYINVNNLTSLIISRVININRLVRPVRDLVLGWGQGVKFVSRPRLDFTRIASNWWNVELGKPGIRTISNRPITVSYITSDVINRSSPFIVNRNLSRVEASMWIRYVNSPRHISMQCLVADIRLRCTVTRLLAWVSWLLVTRLWFIPWFNGDLVVVNLNRYRWNSVSTSLNTCWDRLTSYLIIARRNLWRDHNILIILTSQVGMTNLGVVVINVNVNDFTSLVVSRISYGNVFIGLTILNLNCWNASLAIGLMYRVTIMYRNIN